MANYRDLVIAEAKRQGVNPDEILPLVNTESNFNPNAISPVGAVGLMQVMPATGRELGVQNAFDLLDPATNVRAGVKYYKQQRDRFGSPDLAYAAYNAGPGAVRKAGGIPNYPETQNYVRKNMAQQKNPFDALDNAAPRSQSVAGAVLDAVIPSANAAPAGNPFDAFDAQAQPAARTVNPLTMGVGDIVRGGVQGLVHGIGAIANRVAPNSQVARDFAAGVPQVDAQIRQQEQAYKAQREAAGNTGIDWQRLGGNVLGSGVALAGLPAGGSSMLGQMAAGSLGGALGGALQPVTEGDFLTEKGRQALVGLGLGGGTAGATSLIGRAIAPAVLPEAQALYREGITPTLGQTLGGTAARTEEKLTSVPFLGDAIKGAQRRAIEDTNRAAYNRALSPIGERFNGKVGTEGVRQVADKLSSAYDDVLGRMQLKVDPQFNADVSGLVNKARQTLTADDAKTFENIVRTQLGHKMGQSQQMDGATLKGVQSELRRVAEGYGKDASFDKRQLGLAIGELRNAVDANLARVNPIEDASRLADVNRGWANYSRIRRAASSTGAMNQEGTFTAAQLQSAVRALDNSVQKGNVAKGKALMQDLSTPAQAVIGSKYPDSGTPGRLLLSGLLGGGAVANPAATAAAAGAGLVASAPYSQLGQRLVGNYLLNQSPFRTAVGNAIRDKSGLVGLPAGLLGSQFSQ